KAPGASAHAGRRIAGAGGSRVGLARVFLQAEDGVRDLTVTGVQMWALPIFPPPGRVGVAGPVGDRGRRRRPGLEAEGVGAVEARSEERRVGKEGGARGAPLVYERANGLRQDAHLVKPLHALAPRALLVRVLP